MKVRPWLAAIAAAAAFVAHAASAAPCDRACLTDLMDRWLAALPAHSAAGLPIAHDIRFTEQAAAIPVGDGLFISATEGPTSFKIIAADPVSGQVGAIAVIKQWGKPVMLSVRLKVVDGQ